MECLHGGPPASAYERCYPTSNKPKVRKQTRIVLPHQVLKPRAPRYAWQACAAIYAWYDTTSGLLRAEPARPVEQADELIDRAVATGGPHTIKFTEACLREYALNPSPVYLAAARDAVERVGGM